jgi:hypothetical protein
MKVAVHFVFERPFVRANGRSSIINRKQKYTYPSYPQLRSFHDKR